MTAVTEKMRQDMECPLESVDLSFNSELATSDDNVHRFTTVIEHGFIHEWKRLIILGRA